MMEVLTLAKIITIDRKSAVIVAGVLLICLIGLAGFSLWPNPQTSVSKTKESPEIKMLGLAVEPNSVVKDLTYGSITLKGVHVITSKVFDLIVTVQNTTVRKMVNVPVELQIGLSGDDTHKVTAHGIIQSLEPGATARIAFRQIKALGDALGKSATAGQHLITIRIKANQEGGLNQATEANFRFIVDSTAKTPITIK